VAIKYTEPSQILPGPYFSKGTINFVSSKINLNLVGKFNGNNSEVVSDLNLNVSSITISAWLNEINFTGCWKNIVFVSQNSPLNILAAGTTCGAGGAWRSTPSQSGTPTAGSNLANSWHHIIVEWNSLTGQLYINFDGAVNQPTLTGYPLYFLMNVINIGGATSEQGSVRVFNGSISNVQVYSSVLSSSQITELFTQGSAPVPNAGLVAWYPLDGNPNDYSGNGNNGIATNVQWVSS
jgi:hypothetical protein